MGRVLQCGAGWRKRGQARAQERGGEGGGSLSGGELKISGNKAGGARGGGRLRRFGGVVVRQAALASETRVRAPGGHVLRVP